MEAEFPGPFIRYIIQQPLDNRIHGNIPQDPQQMPETISITKSYMYYFLLYIAHLYKV
jgi:hypothetical protein